MASLRKEIIVVQEKMLHFNNKFYHHNGIYLLFTCIHSKMVAAQEKNLQSMEKEDIQYPAKDEVADDKVYDKFLKLQIPRDPIDLVSNDEDKKDDDDDHHNPKSSSKDEANPRDSTKPPPSISPPKDGRYKGKGIAKGSSQSPSPSTSPTKVMEAAMKEKAHSYFIANPLIGLPNEAPTSTQIVAGKETDPYIEIYPLSELPMLPHLFYTIVLYFKRHSMLPSISWKFSASPIKILRRSTIE